MTELKKEKKTGLVLEGGGMRGIYTAGVLDVFLDHDISFDGVIGVSAGAVHGASFLTGLWEFPQERSTAAPWYPVREAAASAIIKNTAMTSVL